MQLLRKQIKLKILGWFYYGNLIVSCQLRPNLAEVLQTPGTIGAGMALFAGPTPPTDRAGVRFFASRSQ